MRLRHPGDLSWLPFALVAQPAFDQTRLRKTMPSSFDAFLPKTRFQFPDGAILCVGTISCDDQIHQAVYLSYTPAGAATPAMELELPPKTVEVIIQHLQERANEARYINGEKMLEYPKPSPMKPFRPKAKSPRERKIRKAAEPKEINPPPSNS